MHTPADFEDALDDELAWRRSELHAVLSSVRATRGLARDALCRAGVALLYAHWEGYSKAALTHYLKYVARRKLKMKELKAGFVALAVAGDSGGSFGQSSARQRVAMVDKLLGPGEERLHSPSNEVSTHSNLSSDLCHDLMETLGLDFGPFATKAALIDYKLLKARNEIAHGRWVVVTADEYIELHNEVLTLISTMRNVVVAAVEGRAYRRSG